MASPATSSEYSSDEDLFVPRPPARPSCQRLADVLDSIGAIRTCVEFRHDFPQPRLYIDCVGDVTLPLSANDARTIVQSASSHLSFGSTPVAVHLSQDFTINQEFNEYVQSAVDKHLKHIKLPRALTVKVRPARLFSREPGTIGAIEEPGQTGRHGTVAVTFPSTAFECRQSYQNTSVRQIKQYPRYQDGPSDEPIEIRTWHHSMDEKVERQLIAGHRLVLEYDLMSEEPDFPRLFDYDQEVDDAVAAWKADPANKLALYPMDENRIFYTTHSTRGDAKPRSRFYQLLKFLSRAAWKHRCFILHGLVDKKYGVTMFKYGPCRVGPGPLSSHIRLAPGGWSEEEMQTNRMPYHYTEMVCTRIEEDEIMPRSFVDLHDGGWYGTDTDTLVLVRPEALQELAQRRDLLFYGGNVTGILDFFLQEGRRYADDPTFQKTCTDMICRLPLPMARETFKKIISWSLDVKAHELFDIFTARYGLCDKSLRDTNSPYYTNPATLVSETELIGKIASIANCGEILAPERLETWNKWVLPFCLSLLTVRNMAVVFGIIMAKLSPPLQREFDIWSAEQLTKSDPAMWAGLDVADMPLLDKLLFVRPSVDTDEYRAHQDRICGLLVDRLLSMGTRRLWFAFLASLAQPQISSQEERTARRVAFRKLVALFSKTSQNLSVRLSDFSEPHDVFGYYSPKELRLPPERRHICFNFVEIIRRMCRNDMVAEVNHILRWSSAEFEVTSDSIVLPHKIVTFINALAELAWDFRESGDEPHGDLLPAVKEFVLAAIKVARKRSEETTPLYLMQPEESILEALEPLRNEHIEHLFTAQEIAVVIATGDLPPAEALKGTENEFAERAAAKRKRTAEEAGLEELSRDGRADGPVGEAVHDDRRDDSTPPATAPSSDAGKNTGTNSSKGSRRVELYPDSHLHLYPSVVPEFKGWKDLRARIHAREREEAEEQARQSKSDRDARASNRRRG